MKETAYLLQAALIGTWWVCLFASETAFTAFQFDEIPPVAFWSFFLPDIFLIALLSTIRAYRKIQALEHVVLGGFAFATLYCCNATFLTHSGFLPTGLMALGLAYNAFICFSDSLFRSSTTGVRANVIKTLVQIVCIWLIALAVIPFIILSSFDDFMTPTVSFVSVTGVVLFCSFSSLGLASAYFMVRDGDGTPLPLDQTNTLVISGPYRFVRNPMAIAGIGQGIAIAITFHSIPILIYSLLGAIIWHFVVRPIEERDMAKRFGASYLAYRNQIACWIPKMRRPR